MRNFKDLGIKNEDKGFTGDKIKISKVLNREIAVHAFKIVDSKYNGKCLHMQIQINETKHVVFTGSNNLIDMIQKVDKQDFPFRTIIIEENERFEFT